ncbi:MAG: phosphoribosyltransferase family protein [Candidatus Nanopelagicales bacterium]
MFADRTEAGIRLAGVLEHLRGQDVVVLGLPRGGVPVAWQVARSLAAPLDVIVVRKLGVPDQPELAMGAIGEGGVRVLDTDVLDQARITDAALQAVERRERGTLEARVAAIRAGHERVDVRGRTVVIVDDGLATGSTARAAVAVSRALGAAHVVLAVPVGPPGVAARSGADEFVCLSMPPGFRAVGYHYGDFCATSEQAVIDLLDTAARRQRDGRPPDAAAHDAPRDVQRAGHEPSP